MRVQRCAKPAHLQERFNRVATFIAVLLVIWMVGYLLWPQAQQLYNGVFDAMPAPGTLIFVR